MQQSRPVAPPRYQPVHLRLSSIAGFAALLAVLATGRAPAQATSWPTVHQNNGWYGSVFEHALTPRWGVVTDIQVRRAGFVKEPKQLFSIAGVSWKPTTGVRLAVGGGYTASTPYGLLPAPLPTREYQFWYQVQLQQHAGPVDFSHRFRFENRWLHDVERDENGTHPVNERFAHRVRYQIRATHPFARARLHGQPVTVFAANEAFLGLAAAERHVSFDQNRAVAGVGLPLGGGELLEVSYLQQWIANTRYKTNEQNRTLLVMFVHKLPR